MARKIKEDLALMYSNEYGDVVEMVAKARERIKKKYPNSQKRTQIWREIMKNV